jgi:putative ABC transport system permease protein
MRVAVSKVNYPESHHIGEFFRTLSDRIDSLPGVSAVAFTSAIPISERTSNMGVTIDADPRVPGSGTSDVAEFQWVSCNYHSVVGQRLEDGRLFNESDHLESPPVAIINTAMARKFWGNENPVGKSFRTFGTRPVRVVGVVSNVKRFGLNTAAPPECYLPSSWTSGYPSTSLVVRSPANPSLIAGAVRKEVQELDRTATVFRMQTMTTIVSESMARTRFTTLLLSLFAGTAALLACVGIYGVISHYVDQRTREIGLRVAVGATSREILLMVLRRGSILILIGVILGLAGAWALSRVMKSLLFGVSALDPATFVVVVGLSVTVALGACYLPARRAIKVDPMTALRCE